MKFRNLIKLLENDGWVIVRTNGSHRIYQHPTKPGSFPVPIHGLGNDVPKGLEQAILKQVGVTMTVRYPVAVEQSEDSSWCAYTLSPTVITGLGDSREAALADLQSAAKFWMLHMKETGQVVPKVGVEVTSIEVAA